MICYFCGKEKDLALMEMIDCHLWCGCDEGEDWVERNQELRIFDGEIETLISEHDGLERLSPAPYLEPYKQGNAKAIPMDILPRVRV
jgi:hypothetical protein